jgi:hypothetical protein
MIDTIHSHIIDGEHPPVLGENALAYGHLRTPHSMKHILQLEEMYNLPPAEVGDRKKSESQENPAVDQEEEDNQLLLGFAGEINDDSEIDEEISEEESRQDVYDRLRRELEDRGISIVTFNEDRRAFQINTIRKKKGREIESISITVHADVKKVLRRMYFQDYSSKAVDPDIENINNYGRYKVWAGGGGVLSHIEETFDFEGNRLSRRTVRKAPSMEEMNAGIRAGRVYMQARDEAFYLLQDLEVILRNPELRDVAGLNKEADKLGKLIKGKEVVDLNQQKGIRYDYDEDAVRGQIAKIRNKFKLASSGLGMDLPVRIGEHTIKEPQL